LKTNGIISWLACFNFHPDSLKLSVEDSFMKIDLKKANRYPYCERDIREYLDMRMQFPKYFRDLFENDEEIR
jgi:hypothetical protein